MVAMKTIPALLSLSLLASGAAFAQWGDSYIGETRVDTGNLNIAVNTMRHYVLAVGLKNNSAEYARCQTTFSHEPIFTETQGTTIAPGKSATFALRKNYPTNRIDIQVACSGNTHG
jgi:hypothetical protein